MYFRVDFQLLSGLRKKWLSDTQGEMRTFLFTATITPDQKTDILKLFSENDSKQNEFCFHSLRPEISYYNQTFENQSDQQSALTDCLWHLPRPAILYSTEVEMAENFYNIATSLGFRRVGCFTGETKPKERKNLLERWRFDQIDLMIATSAFGLGVDKPDVRSVIHCCFPEDIHRFYQEVGRGGRDGYSSVSILIPTKKDIRVAENMKPKLLSLELVQERWQSLWETRNEVNISEHSWKIRLNSNRPELLGDRTYQENIKWNKRLILQLARAQQILIQDLSFDTDESGKFEDYQEYLTIRLLDGVNPDSPTFGESIKEQRGIESKSVEQGFQYLLDYLSADRCISMTLKKVFGEETYRSCGGCKWCRKEGRNPGDAPVFEYDNRNATKQVRVVGICEHPLDGNKKVFIKKIRKLYDSGIRRYSCNANVFNHLLDLFNVALGNNNLFRLDIVDEGLDLLNPEPVVVFHTNAPTISAIKICGASQVTHVLCGSLSYENIRYLLDSSFRNYEYFSKFDLLN
jgi:ATP-dependent DNA helicase RecQ